jgi:hypothetical protein
MNSGDHSGDPGHSPRRVLPRGRRRPPLGGSAGRHPAGRCRTATADSSITSRRTATACATSSTEWPGPGEPLGDGGAVPRRAVSEALASLRREPDDGAPGVAGIESWPPTPRRPAGAPPPTRWAVTSGRPRPGRSPRADRAPPAGQDPDARGMAERRRTARTRRAACTTSSCSDTSRSVALAQDTQTAGGSCVPRSALLRAG